MATETMYDHDTFLAAISNGLKEAVTLPSLSTFTLLSPSSPLTSLSLLPSYTSSPQLPSYPVVYAVVGGGSASEDPPALVPLQVRHSIVKVVAESNPNLTSSVHVKYHTSWFLTQLSSSLILAVPVGFGGSLLSYEFTDHSQHKSAPFQRVELDATYKPHFKNIYLFSFRWVDVLRRSREIVTVVSCVQKFSNIDQEQGLYSFTVPLSLPSYVALRPLKELGSQTLRLILECKGTGTILEHDISSHPLIELITDGRRRILYHESRSYSDKDLTCSFKVSTPVIQVKLYHEEASFIRSVEQGLKLTSGHEQVSLSPESFLPTAPVLYAVVSNMNIMNTNTTGANKACQLPALVPLQMMSLSVKINAEPMADSLCVQFNGRWSVQCIKDDHTSPLILAVPVGCGGQLLHYEIHAPPQSPTVLKTEEYTASNKPLFGNLYLVPLPPCKGGADVSIKFRCCQDVIQKQGVFSFTIPLSVPKYVCGSSIKEKIRVTIECKDGRRITSCIVSSHHLTELISSDMMRVLVGESVGYSEKDLSCEFVVAR